MTSNIKNKLDKLRKNKLGQEEIIGFALIIIIVAVILLIFLSFSLSDSSDQNVESYEVESFIQSSLEITSECENPGNSEYFSVNDLVIECGVDENQLCNENSQSNERVCEALERTFREISRASWPVSENGETPIKGYKLEIISRESNMLTIEEGQTTNTYKGTLYKNPRKRGVSTDIIFNVYY